MASEPRLKAFSASKPGGFVSFTPEISSFMGVSLPKSVSVSDSRSNTEVPTKARTFLTVTLSTTTFFSLGSSSFSFFGPSFSFTVAMMRSMLLTPSASKTQLADSASTVTSRTWIVSESNDVTSTSALIVPSVKASGTAYPSGLASLTPEMSSLPVYGFRLTWSRLKAVPVYFGTSAFASDVATGLIQSGNVRTAKRTKASNPPRNHSTPLTTRRAIDFFFGCFFFCAASVSIAVSF